MVTIYCSPAGRYVELQARSEPDMSQLQRVVDCGLGVLLVKRPDWMRVQIPVDRKAMEDVQKGTSREETLAATSA